MTSGLARALTNKLGIPGLSALSAPVQESDLTTDSEEAEDGHDDTNLKLSLKDRQH